MKTSSLGRIFSFIAGAVLITCAQFGAYAQLTVQRPCNAIGTGSNAWNYLVLEGESYIPESKVAAEGTGFTKLWNDEVLVDGYGIPMLVTNTGASMQGALGAIGPTFGRFADKVTYQVVFSNPGDYYMYMRFTMFDISGNSTYLNEDSFFLPPDFNKDPQNDWNVQGNTTTDNGGYTEGCCGGAGFLHILDYQGNGSRTDHSTDTNYFGGNFHWNQLFVSQFLSTAANTNLDGSPMAGQRFHYVVTPAMVGTTQFFTIAYREQGVTVDLFLFSTKTNLLNDYTQAQMDDLLVKKVQVQDPANTVVTASNSWSFLVMEAEDFMAKSNRTATVGFGVVAPGSTNVDAYGTPMLMTNTTASHKAALTALNPSFGRFSDKISYQVTFSTPGDYYMYMRFTMFDINANNTYLNEDSYFLPPDFNKDPQFDWNVQGNTSTDNGGYTEGCCSGAGFLHILDYQGNGSRTDHSTDTNYFEGNFHWNQLFVSQFLSTTANTNLDGSPMAGQRFHYVVTPAMVGVPQNFTIAYREPGISPDLWLFSTHTNLLNDYTQAELDQLTLQPRLSIANSGTNVVVSWSISAACGFILESRTAVGSGSWTTVETPSVVNGSRYELTVTPTGASQYYRLRQP